MTQPAPDSLRPAPRVALFPVLIGILAFLCLAFRAVHLRALPIFCDESIYLRWAQLIRGEGVAAMHPWISLVDPKPPLHFWLIAAVFHAADDPLLAARALSALAGAATIPLIAAVAVELARLDEHRIPAALSGRAWAMVAAMLAVACPFLAFYQRLATADALFVAESLLIVCLSLRWSRRAYAASPRAAWGDSLALGAALGAGLMTRQGLSYTLFAVPLLAWWIRARPTRGLRVDRRLLQVVAAFVVAGACWAPFLTVDLHTWAQKTAEEKRGTGTPVTTRDLLMEVKRRAFYQDNIAGGGLPDKTTMWKNARAALVPGWTADGTPNSGWFWLYLTPAVCLLALVGLALLAWQRPWAFVLLVTWLLAMLLPVFILGHSVFSRYVLAGVPPLLLAAAWALAMATQWLSVAPVPRVVGILGAALLWGAAFVPAMMDIARQVTDWSHQTLTVGGRGVYADRYQYLTGWPAGYASEQALDDLRNLATQGPIIVVTDGGWGTVADPVWVYLSTDPHVHLYYSDDRVFQPSPEMPGAYLLKTDKFLYPQPSAVTFPPGVPVLYVLNMPEKARDDALRDLVTHVGLARMRANLGEPRTFYGIDGPDNGGVVIFPVTPVPR